MNLKDQILKEHSAKNAELIADFIETNPDKLEDLLNIVLGEDKLLSQRSAWVLAKFSGNFYPNFIPHLDFILAEITNAKHNAIHRNFSKVFMALTNKENIEFLTDIQIDAIVDISFGWVIDKKEKAAVVACGMYTLENLLERRDWIASNLKLHIVENMSSGLPSFRAAGKKVLKSIDKLNKFN